MADEAKQQAARDKLYRFISDPANRNDPDLDVARELLAELPKTGMPSWAKPTTDLYGSRATDEQAGVRSGPEQTKPYHFRTTPGGTQLQPPERGGPPDEAYLVGQEAGQYRDFGNLRPEFARAQDARGNPGGLGDSGKDYGYYVPDAFEDDVIAQMAVAGPAGRAVRTALTPGQSVSPVLRLLGGLGAGAAEGLVTSQMMGGDAAIGAGLGAGVPLAGGALGMLGKAAMRSPAGRTAANAVNTLESAGVPLSKPPQTFNSPSTTMMGVDALEAGADAANIDAARKALQFHGPGGHEGALGAAAGLAHFAHIPYAPHILGALGAANMLSRNATPLIGRVGIPAARALEGVDAQAVLNPLLQTTAAGVEQKVIEEAARQRAAQGIGR